MSAAAEPAERIEVRASRRADAYRAAAAAELIDGVADEFDIVRRAPEWLRDKIEAGRAALALKRAELVGFGYWSAWEGGRFVSHSGLVVRADLMRRGIARRLKTVLFESSRRELPHATLMSLTNSPPVKRLNLSLGFRVVPLDRLTSDPEFWAACKTCRNYADVQARGERCCCEGLIREPEDTR